MTKQNLYHPPGHPLSLLVSRMREYNGNMNRLGAFLSARHVCSTAHSSGLDLRNLLLNSLQKEAASLKEVKSLGAAPQGVLYKPSLADVKKIFAGSEEAAKTRSFSAIMADKRTAQQDRLLDQEAAEALGLGEVFPEEVATIYESLSVSQPVESFSMSIILNERQLMAKEMALAGKDFVLIGPAGSGKTTAQRSVAESLLQSNRLRTCKYKIPAQGDQERSYRNGPSIAFCAYTRRAASNLAKAIHKSDILRQELPCNIMTIHALLEFEPEMYFDSTEQKDKFRFSPKRTSSNPLEITHLVIEEASMLGLDLWAQLYDALPSDCQIIFIGDINQLPPVFGPSILNYALTQLPIVELVETYRNQGIVLENAHNILAGRSIVEDKDFVVVRSKSNVQVGQTKMSIVIGNILRKMNTVIGSDGLLEYDPEDCIILSPWNKAELGTINLNNWIAQFLGEKRGAVVHEVLAGFNKHYLAVGDKVMFNKRDALITDIHRNPLYFGKEPQLAGKTLSRFGVRIMADHEVDSLESIFPDYSNFSLDALMDEKAERKQQSSHVVIIEYDDGSTEEITAAGDFGPATFSLGYALTVHKAQGSEWRKVFLVMHNDFSNMLFRELFYTAVTRARTKVTIIAHDTVIAKAIKSQRIKGNTLQAKLDFFNKDAKLDENVYASKRQRRYA